MYLDRMDTRSAIAYYQDGVHTFSVRDEDWKWKEKIWRPNSLRYSMVYRPLVLSVPGRKVVVGKSWNVVYAIRNLGQCEPFDVAGRCTLTGIEVRDAERMGVIEGKLRFRRALSPSEKSKSTAYRVRGFDIAYKALFSETRNRVVEATYSFGMQVELKAGKLTRVFDIPRRKGRLHNLTTQEFQSILDARKKELKEKGVDPVPQAEIDQALEKATQFLLHIQQKDGSWWSSHSSYQAGPTAIAVLALLKVGLDPDHKAIQDGMEYLRRHSTTKTYGLGLLCMVLRAFCDAKEKKARPVGQAKKRGKARKVHVCRLNSKDRKWLGDLVKLLRQQSGKGCWGYGGGSGEPDHSNTQYAVLGLRSAELCGQKVDVDLWHKVLRHFVEVQNKKGPAKVVETGGTGGTPRGWPYRDPDPYKKTGGGSGTMTMTCAGLASVLIAQDQLQSVSALRNDEKRIAFESIRDSVQWISKKYDQTMNRFLAASKNGELVNDGYLLYGLERAGVLAQKQRFNGRDWYQEGARLLLDAQVDSGEFPGKYDMTVETSFGILFLKRATIPIPGPVITGD
jgi:hypothetical protein